MNEMQNLWSQNMEMWNKMTSTYMDSMYKAFEKTMEQSTSFQKQVTEATNTAVSAQFEAMLAGIKSLEQQVQALSDKVDQYMQAED